MSNDINGMLVPILICSVIGFMFKAGIDSKFKDFHNDTFGFIRAMSNTKYYWGLWFNIILIVLIIVNDGFN